MPQAPLGTYILAVLALPFTATFLPKKHRGRFVLRVEDTDKQRSTEEAKTAILNGLKWLGLDWDEGPFFQSERNGLYRQALEQLLENKQAYYCNCLPETLEEKRQRARAAGEKPKYDGHCREKNLADGPNCVVRFKAPDKGTTIVNDLIKGEVKFENSELDDMVIRRTDGSPTYNFVVVVDDAEMQITHVIRGDDHLNNTPKQILLYQALKYDLPQFAHLPLILGQDKARLSKRHGATSVDQYREQGFLPEAMVNFLARIGWSHGDDEIFSRAELIEKFNLENISKAAGVFNEEKLLWLNHHYLRELSDAQIDKDIANYLPENDVARKYIKTTEWNLLRTELRERCKRLTDFLDMAVYFFYDDFSYDEKSIEKFLTSEIKPAIKTLENLLAKITTFNETSIEATFKQVLEAHDLKMKPLAQAIRVALTGQTYSPGIFKLLYIVGKDRTIERLQRAQKLIDDKDNGL